MKPIATVITPVYQTPPALFEQAFLSLAEQTVGFDTIEWLVAVHNMDDAYTAGLRGIVGDRDNVTFLRAEGGHSPSVPRNLCLASAAGQYVFFLDSDDRMGTDCLEKVIAAMEESHADTVAFGCDFIVEAGAAFADTQNRLNAPDQDLVVYERGDPRIASLMADWGGMLWSRAYRRSFLDRIALRFDETAQIGEDLIFNLRAAALAQRVCVLPRLTGYYHRQWPGSVIQSSLFRNNETEKLIRYLPDIKAGDAQELLWYQLSFLAFQAMRTKSPGARSSQLRDMLDRALDGLRVMAPRFAYTRERVIMVTQLCASVFSLSAKPRLRQRSETLEKPLTGTKVLRRVKAAAGENVELRTIGTENTVNPFLGISNDEAHPEVNLLDLRQMPGEQQAPHMESYRRVELLRGFGDGEVHCRVNVFLTDSPGCVLSFTWDNRFVGEQGIARLQDWICGDMDGAESESEMEPGTEMKTGAETETLTEPGTGSGMKARPES